MQHWQRSVVPMSKSAARDIVLVVDDSPDTLRMLTDAIEDAGMTVLVAREGAQALAMITRVTPDVILMDAVMPGMDGFETTRQLKHDKGLAHVPVIFMTGLSETGDIIKGLNAGADDYLMKPFSFAELVARVAALGRRRLGLAADTVLAVADLEVNLLSRAVRRANVAIELLPREFLLLEYLF